MTFSGADMQMHLRALRTGQGRQRRPEGVTLTGANEGTLSYESTLHRKICGCA